MYKTYCFRARRAARGRISGGSGRPSVAPRPPKLLVPKREGRRRLLQLPKSLFSSPDDSTKLHSGPAGVAELERKGYRMRSDTDTELLAHLIAST